MTGDRAHALVTLRRAEQSAARKLFVDATDALASAERRVSELHHAWWRAMARLRAAEERLTAPGGFAAGRRALLESLMEGCRADAAEAAAALVTARESRDRATVECEASRAALERAVRARAAAVGEATRAERRAARARARREQSAADDLAQDRRRR
jgi:hypothetical protein